MNKVAHQPHINLKMREKLVTPRTYQEGMAKMMHFIDAAKNHSKFYEMAIVPDDYGTYTLVRMWGALTDLSGGAADPRVSTKIHENLSLPEAQMEMRTITAEKLGKGYKDTFRENRGQYPIGLTRNVGFGWGTQDATKSSDAIPALRKLLFKLDAAIDAGERMEADDMAVSLAEVSRILFDMPASSMAKDLQRKLSTPAKQLLSGNVNPKLLSRALKVVRNSIDNQLSAIGRMASTRSVLVKLASSLPVGSPERKAILAGLQGSTKKASYGEFNIPEKHIFDNAKVNDNAVVRDDARVSGNAQVFGNAEVYGEAKVYGKAEVFGNAEVYGNAKVKGKAYVFGKARISGTAIILGGFWDGSEGEITSGTWRGPGVPA